MEHNLSTKVQTIGLLSPGHMGHLIGLTLQRSGFNIITSLHDRSTRTKNLSEKANILNVGTIKNLVNESDILLSIVPPQNALEVATTVASEIQSSGKTALYVDCNAIAPQTTKKIGSIIIKSGFHFIDGGIIGSPPSKNSITRLYVSGPKANDITLLNTNNFSIIRIGDLIGTASALKMCYAALTKGTAALQLAQLTVAQILGIDNYLEEELLLSKNDLYTSMKNSLPKLPAKTHRWIEEMNQISLTFKSAGVTGSFHSGAKESYKKVSKTSFAQEDEIEVDSNRTLKATIDELVKIHKNCPE